MGDPIQDKANAFVTVISALTVKRIVLAVVAGFFSIMGWTAWESRAIVAVAIVNSPTLMWTVGVGIAVATIGFIIHGLVKRIEDMNQKRVDELSSRLKEVEDELIECKVSCKAEAVATAVLIKDALARIEQKLEK